MKGIPLAANGNKIHFCRHAQSQGNIGNISVIDSPLTGQGIEQAKMLEGHFDIVICSPMRRCLETLHYSNLTYDKLIISQDIRERVQSLGDTIMMEQRIGFSPETDASFFKRMNDFTYYLENMCKEMSGKEILILSHDYFFNAWYRRGCFPCPENAKVYHLDV